MHAILSRIANGRLEPGQRLPACTALAAEMRVNKNTVSRAYQSLAAEGYVSSRPGRGTFVAPLTSENARRMLRPRVEESLHLAVQEAKLAGMTRLDFVAAAGAAADHGFGLAELRIGYVDCVPHDAAALSGQLQAALGAPVAPLLLDDVLADPGRTLSALDLVGVSMSHLGPVDAARRARGLHRPELVGLLALPDPAGLARIARLRAGTRVAVVCDQEPTLRTVLPLLEAYNHGLRLDGGLSTDAAWLAAAVEWAGVAVVTVSALDHLPGSGRDIHTPVITLGFRLEPTSTEEMATRVRRLTTGQVTSHGIHQ